ncbi:hypothetical protein PHYSODRAFT_292784 [Phytophthora sojae]|uniref:RxLR effector protein n=2 Tax=Phytophthora sojae TaxID=67593 RepID=G5AIN7_PHYSP|nr:hypothetical protein PHYSODRAFT_288545 [Phytophthora sojae]XP_009539938.1 hypothetical protein PHYSODRAFT_292784 [Phytophthora sojae]AEK80804.1 Avh165 [Phytophthora sojae]AEK80805.1 Avh165 [Phytophthora sojae]EGZ04647.1 hypothetical protein PHYSODRAFT_292784 [Phytophthora sojae]EGZ10037.1 hypothetical protein PHYSODRAFT_288545 [Phytophthora sojae]|eukprot:XP_009534898.1 hypothetical protein PHYSODRAFT_288545 [Phytophthora sojae]
MRLHGIIALLAAAVLLSAADAAAAKTSPPAIAHSFIAAKNDAPTTRMLRNENRAEGDDEEERAIGDAIGGAITGLASKVQLKFDLRNLLNEGKSADDALALLKFDDKVDDLLSNRRKLKKLTKYVARYKNKFPESDVTVVGTLTNKYGDHALAGMLEAAMSSTNPKTKALAEKLQAEQFRLWHNSASYGGVFGKLELDMAYNPLKGNVYKAWRSYFNVYNNHAEAKAKTTEFKVLKKVFGRRDFAGMIQKAKHDEESGLIAMEFERELFNSWISRKIAPDEVVPKIFRMKSEEKLTKLDNAVTNEYTRWWATAARGAAKNLAKQ